jgi:excisionase family DNA binding protein
MSEETFMTTPEVATWLRIHRRSIYRLIQAGLPCYHAGRALRFKREEVEAWMREERTRAQPTALPLVRASQRRDPKPSQPSREGRVPGMSTAEAHRQLKEIMRG